MSAVAVDGTLVQELDGEMIRVRVEHPSISELKPGDAIELNLDSTSQRYLGTILAVDEEDLITVLMDRVAMTEQVALVEDSDRATGGLPDRVEPIRGMDAG